MNCEHTLTREHNRLVAAPIEWLWQRHTQIGDWPAWNADIVAVDHEPPLCHGRMFTIVTATGSWRIRVYAFVPEARLLIWGARLSNSCTWLQSWTFEPSNTAVRVSASTSVSGTAPAALDVTAARLHDGVESWLDRLQLAAEARTLRGA